MGVSNFSFDIDSGILQDEDGLVGVSHPHHEQQVGLTEAGEGVADPLSGSTNDGHKDAEIVKQGTEGGEERKNMPEIP